MRSWLLTLAAVVLVGDGTALALALWTGTLFPGEPPQRPVLGGWGSVLVIIASLLTAWYVRHRTKRT